MVLAVLVQFTFTRGKTYYMRTKIIIAGIIAVLTLSVWTLFVQNKNLKQERNIQASNVNELLAEKAQRTALILSYEQAQGISTLKIDSLSNALKIKPKTIIKTVEKLVVVHDTTIKEVQVLVLGKDKWQISDQDKCWTWKGTASLQNDSLKVDRVLFDYHNKTTDIYYWQRTKHCWFIKYGKKKTFMKSSSECGESYTREISISKQGK